MAMATDFDSETSKSHSNEEKGGTPPKKKEKRMKV